MMYDARRTCPVCERRFEEEGPMRAHLLTTHHKSELADAVAEAVSETGSRESAVPTTK